MAVTAVQVTTSSALIFDASSYSAHDEVTIQNLGPNAIYIDFGEAATTAGSLQIPSNSTYTCSALEDIYAICGTLQVTPLDTRISVERLS